MIILNETLACIYVVILKPQRALYDNATFYIKVKLLFNSLWVSHTASVFPICFSLWIKAIQIRNVEVLLTARYGNASPEANNSTEEKIFPEGFEELYWSFQEVRWILSNFAIARSNLRYITIAILYVQTRTASLRFLKFGH